MLQSFFRDRLLVGGTSASALFLLLLWTAFVVKVPRGGETVILHYTIYLGVDEVGAWYRLFIFPLTGTLIAALNTVAAIRFMKSAKMFSIFLVYSSLCLQVLLCVEGAFILLQNI